MRPPGHEPLEYVLQEHQTKRDVFAVLGLHIAPELVSRIDQLRFKTDVTGALDAFGAPAIVFPVVVQYGPPLFPVPLVRRMLPGGMIDLGSICIDQCVWCLID